jgi:hypothetical protein
MAAKRAASGKSSRCWRASAAATCWRYGICAIENSGKRCVKLAR